MPTATVEGTVQSFTYEQLMQWANLYGSTDSNVTFQQWANEAAKYGVGEEDALLDFLSKGKSGLQVERAADGTYRGWFYNSVEQAAQTNPINSNASTISRGNLRQMVGQKWENVSGTLTRNMTRFPASGSLGQKAGYLLGSVGSAATAVSTGIWLGKTIDSALYNANPDYWDSIGLSSLNPETWNSITNGSDSPFAGLFNFILGLDPDTGEAQAYMNQDALAYMAYALAQNGFFNASDYSASYDGELPSGIADITQPLALGYGSYWQTSQFADNPSRLDWTYETSTSVYVFQANASGSLSNPPTWKCWLSREPFMFGRSNSNPPTPTPTENAIEYTTFNGTTFYARVGENGYGRYMYTGSMPINSISGRMPSAGSDTIRAIGTIVFDGHLSGTMPGVGNQPNATLPDISTWTDIPSTLQSLQQQYPDAFDNALVWDNDADDGTAQQTTWIPVPFPQMNSATDSQPTSGTQTQTSTDVSTIPDDLIKLITQIVQQTQTQTDTTPETPPQNPVDTGTGNTPQPVAPTGEASALWSVYHPTQAQVNAFGGWLWSASFVDQLLRVFENPMDAVVSLRKVFVTPVDAGNTTIHAGYLDSEVPSAYITQQYVYKDCGYVDCSEQFGNVFDYTETQISIYLPFIGIVSLNTAEVMRSTLHVIYGVDMFTGACLATIEVQRDGNTVTMYQYSGNASVEYPLSGQRASSFLGGLMSLGGATALAATGGGSVMAAGMALHGIQQMSTVNVQHSGGFSGNAGAMGIKIPYLIIERPQTKVATTFPRLAGYPTNYSCKLGDCTNHVVVKHVHVEGINATDTELSMIEDLLKEGVLL